MYVPRRCRHGPAVNMWGTEFTSDFRLASGASVYLHTGRGTNTPTHRYWGSGAYIWNNTGDTAYVRNSAGTLMDSCSWGSSGSYTNC